MKNIFYSSNFRAFFKVISVPLAIVIYFKPFVTNFKQHNKC